MDNQPRITQKTLLPQGFHDMLSPQANLERQINKTLLDNFSLFGYNLVRPALLEFEEESSATAQNSFRVTDPISGRMLALRTDITPQISRIAADRLEFTPESSTRLSYTGQVIRKQGRGRHTERQLTQTGIELLGRNTIQKDSEILFIALDSLAKLGITEYTVDFCIPSIINEILQKENLTDSQKSKVISLIEKKDFAALEQSSNRIILEILDICARSSSDNYSETLDKISALDISENARSLIADLKKLIEGIFANGIQFNLSIDVLESMGFEYHTGICYSIFSNKTLEELCRAGRYRIVKSQNHIDAVGFTFLVNALSRVGEIPQNNETKKIPYSEGFAKSTALREQGVITIFEE
jgi:ATP phosphoribosyltransferase regulatory subunit